MPRPRRRVGWWKRLGAVADPKTIATGLLVLGSCAQQQSHTDRGDKEADGELRAVRSYIIAVDLRADSAFALARGLTAKVQRLERAARASGRRSVAASMDQTSEDEPVVYGPPQAKGALLKALFGWLPH